MSEIEIVRLDTKNIHKLYELYEQVYHKRVAKNYFHLKYATEYTGVQSIGFFAHHNNVPVAHIDLCPMWVSIAGARIGSASM